MNILFISSIKPEYIENIYDNLVRAGNDVYFIQYKRGNNLFEKLVAIFNFLKEIRKHLKKDYDVINVQYPFVAVLAFLFIDIDTPIVTTLHGSDAIYEGIDGLQLFTRKMFAPLLRIFLNKSSVITVNTVDYKQRILKKYRIPKEKIWVCPAAGFNRKVFFNHQYKVNDIPKIGFAGRLIRNKGWDTFIETYRYLRLEKKKDVIFQIVGYGMDANKIEQKIKIVNKEIGDKHLEFLGEKNEEEIGDFYRQLDLFLFPTRFNESLGLVGIESLACGTPVIASNRGGIKSYLHHGSNGFLVEPTDILEIGGYIINYLKLSTNAKRAMQTCAVKSVTQYEEDHASERLQAIFKTVIENDSN